MKSLFEELGGTYRREGDYFVPDLSLMSEESEIRIGKYGRMRKRFLKEHRPALYANLLLSGTLTKHLAEIDRSCLDRLENIETVMMKQEGVTETLKASKSDRMGQTAKLHSRQSRGSRPDRTCICLTNCPLPAFTLIPGILFRQRC